ncbi:MAG: hypothetical protein KGL39_29545 [Patescibacteria group bacterium]|nr:hypothetical protein [Patescibacteria group bacterium]
MKLEPGKNWYPLPPVGSLQGVIVDGRFMVEQVDLRDIVRLRQAYRTKFPGADLRAFPTHVALAPTLDRLEFFPCPDKAYEARVRFFPPLQEI